MTQAKVLGAKGEQAVSLWLQQFGYTILTRNFNSKYGEIDIIACKDDVVAFIEVKTRLTEYFPISNTVTRSKQKKLAQTAKIFVLQNKISNKVLRFDVATVTPINQSYQIHYIQNAFQT
ncbi:MAG: YraN family protein [bacterium]